MSSVIALTRGLVALVDDCDYEWLTKSRWCARQGAAGKLYAYRRKLVAEGSTKERPVYAHMHREIMMPPDGLVVDHLNGDGLDNRRSNLRICSKRENSIWWQKMTQWQPIETVPSGRTVLLFSWSSDRTNWKMATGWYSDGAGLWEWDGRWLDKPYDQKPTHWQPLPEPPNA